MIPIALEDSAGSDRAEVLGGDRLGHAVRVALAIYLMPVVAIVCVIGGASILVTRASRLVSRIGEDRVRLPQPSHLSIARPLHVRERRRTRVTR